MLIWEIGVYAAMVRQPILARDVGAVEIASARRFRRGIEDYSVTPDNYHERLIKFIPGESLAAFLAISGIIPQVETGQVAIEWIAFSVIFVSAGLLAWKTATGDTKSHVIKAMVAMMAFLAWVFGIGGPFSHFNWYEDAYGSIVVVIFVLLAPALVK